MADDRITIRARDLPTQMDDYTESQFGGYQAAPYAAVWYALWPVG